MAARSPSRGRRRAADDRRVDRRAGGLAEPEDSPTAEPEDSPTDAPKSVAAVYAGMEVECRFFGPFRDAVDDDRTVLDVDLDTYGELLTLLEARYPGLSGRLLDEDGDGFAGSTVVTRNGTDLRHLDGLETAVEEGDVVRAVPSVYGGRGTRTAEG